MKQREFAGRWFVAVLLLLAGLGTGSALAGELRDRLLQRVVEKQAESARTAVPEDARADDSTHAIVRDRLLSAARGKTDVNTMKSGWFSRSYRIFIPDSAPEHPPLVIVLHGTYGTGEKMQRALGFDSYASQNGFLVAYPDAYSSDGGKSTTRWNDGRGVLESSALGVDDVKFISGLIDEIVQKYGADPKRVFVTGSSNGGIMSFRIGCQLRGKVRAIAPEIANIAEPILSTCSPEAGMSVLAINGREDPIVPLDGGDVCKGISKKMCEGGRVLSHTVSMAMFTRASHCSPSPDTSLRPVTVDDGTEVEDQVFSGCSYGAEVRSIVVHGMGHVWPPHNGQISKSGSSSKNLDATEEIVKFFLSQK